MAALLTPMDYACPFARRVLLNDATVFKCLCQVVMPVLRQFKFNGEQARRLTGQLSQHSEGVARNRRRKTLATDLHG